MHRALKWIKEIYTNWRKNHIASLSAALAYYTIFSLVPILLICISIVGTLFGEEVVRSQLLAQINSLLGEKVSLQIQEMIQNIGHPTTVFVRKLASMAILLFSASGAFNEIQEGLNTIWNVKSNPNKDWLFFIKNRLSSFTMVLVCAFLLFLSLALSPILAVLNSQINHLLGADIFFELVINHSFSFLITTLLFAMMFKYLPDVKLQWNNVWMGALITSLLFSLGKILIEFYVNKIYSLSLFGGADALIILLLWIYYSAQIFFIGAAITKIYSTKRKIKIIPVRSALLINEKINLKKDLK